MPTQAALPRRVSVDAPDGWFDRTMIVYSAPAENGGAMAPTIVIGRDALGRGESFREFCNRQVETFRASLAAFHRESEEPGRVHDLDAFQIRFTWQSAGGLLRQRVFFIAAGDGLIVTFAGTAAAEDGAAHDAVFERALATLRIEG